MLKRNQQYSEILEKKYQHAGKRDKKERILLAKEKLMQDKISIGIWEIIISFTTLAANLVTAGSIFGML
ncbi:MAG: hypothetical protein K2O16_19065 [Lachnospiraceae bacterium]|nr:hypothetical protein [Lachnospiraceae bacterium]